MRLSSRLSAVLFGAAIVMVQPLVANALTSEKIYSIAQQITVRIDGTSKGSGIILEHQGNTYTVITSMHVLKVGSYKVQTPDGKQYTFNHSQVKGLSGVDLATFQFQSNQTYSVAEKGDSDQVTGGKTIYVAGYPDGTPNNSERSFQFLQGLISGRVEKPKSGYALMYPVNAFPGMSGGPILDEQGKLVGIHGRCGTRPDTNATLSLGIPLKTYSGLASTASPTNAISYLTRKTSASSYATQQANDIIRDNEPYVSIAQQASNDRVNTVRSITNMINDAEYKFRGEIHRAKVH